jgi:cell wall-associated NlpC family hydrolase
MKRLIPVMLLVVLPRAAHAQIDIIFSGSQPVLRANVGPLTVSARMGSRGIDMRVDERRTTVPTSRQPRERSRTTGAARATASGVLATADTYVGTKYVWGGETPGGFDCSGFVQYVFQQHGVELPRTSRQQAAVGHSVTRTLGALRPGDLMLFATNGQRIDHIAIYVGGNEIIHSSASGGGVGYDRLTTKRGKWFASHHVATRRVLANGESLVGPLTAALRAFAEFDPPDRAPKR